MSDVLLLILLVWPVLYVLFRTDSGIERFKEAYRADVQDAKDSVDEEPA